MDPAAQSAAGAASGAPADKFYRAAWRWHFYTGLLVVPFFLILAVTGLIMVLVDEFSGRDGEFVSIDAGTEAAAISRQVAAAVTAVPGSVLGQYIHPRQADHAAIVRVEADGVSHLVAVNPYGAEVIDHWVATGGIYDLATRIHGTLLIGDTGDRIIEIAAGFGILLLITGLYIWWPRTGRAWLGALVPDLSARGRPLWKSLHQVVGFWISALLLVFLVSGMAWTGVWGGQIVQAWSSFPAEKWENVPLSDATHASLNHDSVKDVPWALEQTALPVSGSDAGSTGIPDGQPVTLDSVAALAKSIGFDARFRVNPPSGAEGVWTISRDSMSNDSFDPFSDRVVHIDRYTGNILADVRFDDYSLAGKSMAVGIAFHQGDMGTWNMVLNVAFCLAVIFLTVSGVVMWWIRRPKKAGRLVAPPIPVDLPLWKGAVFFGLLVSMAFPLVGITLLAILAFDLLVLRNIPALKKAVS